MTPYLARRAFLSPFGSSGGPFPPLFVCSMGGLEFIVFRPPKERTLFGSLGPLWVPFCAFWAPVAIFFAYIVGYWLPIVTKLVLKIRFLFWPPLWLPLGGPLGTHGAPNGTLSAPDGTKYLQKKQQKSNRNASRLLLSVLLLFCCFWGAFWATNGTLSAPSRSHLRTQVGQMAPESAAGTYTPYILVRFTRRSCIWYLHTVHSSQIYIVSVCVSWPTSWNCVLGLAAFNSQHSPSVLHVWFPPSVSWIFRLEVFHLHPFSPHHICYTMSRNSDPYAASF